MTIDFFLRKDISALLGAEPFCNWKYQRTVEKDLEEPAVYYSFKKQGLDIQCNLAGCINTIFIHTNAASEIIEELSGFSFTAKQSEIQDSFGKPTKSGEEVTHPILGNFGPWDLYSNNDYSIHFHFEHGVDRIKLITLMINDVVPR